MNRRRTYKENKAYEVDLLVLARDIWDKKIVFALSLAICMAIAYLYTQVATPVYQASTSLFFDLSGKNREFGENYELLGDEVMVMQRKKNLYNEMGTLSSFHLLEETMKELNFDVSYYTGSWYGAEEHYGFFPFTVELIDTMPQMFEVPFYLEILSDSQYRLTVESRNFTMSNPTTHTTHIVDRKFYYSETHSFGEPVISDYFHFIIKKTDSQRPSSDFQDKELFFKVHDIESLADSYQEKLEVEEVIGASMLRLKSRGEVVKKEITFLEKLSAKYIETKLNERKELAQQREDFIRGQLSNISDSLAQAELKVESFKRNGKIVNLAQKAITILNKIIELESSRTQYEWQIKYCNALIKYLADSSKIDKVIAPVAMGINDPLLNHSLQELQKLYSEKSRMSYFKGRQSHDIKMLDAQILDATRSIQENLKNLIRASEESLKSINQRIEQQEEHMAEVPRRQNQLAYYERKSTLFQNLYNYLSQELAKTEISREENIRDIKVLDEATMTGSKPVTPQNKLIMLIGVLVGLALPLTWLIIHESLDDTVQDILSLENATDIPVAASIAHLDSKHKSIWQVKESFRELCAKVFFTEPDARKKIIGLGSTIPNEGKTFCAIHLARSLADAGKKVILVDADFRVPSQIKSLVDITGYGLSDYLMDEHLPIEEAIYFDAKQHNLHYLPTRIEDRNPQVILTSARMKPMMARLKEDYDYIIIDSPALGLVSDYLLLSRFIDFHLFVLRRKHSKLTFLSGLEKLVKKGNIDSAHLVLNDVPGEAFYYGESYYMEEAPEKLMSLKI
ncbi:MAG: AAA family ATPase [Lewinellaceae bacterium]|nr:AAA family ATPase [Phaeodactylibacter sp.]MCB9350390.1 AAA family ATPase [Lewinellaceae bacterium]